MTTIAFRDGVIAADSQLTHGSRILGGVRKIFKHGDYIYGLAGGFARTQALKAFIESKGERCAGSLPSTDHNNECEAEAFRFGPSGIEFYESLISRPAGEASISWNLLDAEFCSIGTGCGFAMGAMAAGASAAEAVAIACRYDVYSGGEVVTLTLG